MKINRELLERVNPVFNTAKMTVFQMAELGDENAKKISEAMHLTLEETQGEVDEDEMLVNCTVLETRYRAIAELAKTTGCPTVVDLPCGYTPRAIEFAKEGRPYVGLDLPAAIVDAEPVIMSLIDEDKRHLVRFKGIDATNYPSLKEVFDSIQGEVCITTEGLLMYFADSEIGELCTNIRRLLAEHGGCWLLADAEISMQYVVMAQAILGERFMEVMKKGVERTSEKSDVDVGSRTLVVSPNEDVPENIKKAMLFLGRYGLKAERLIAADYVPELESLKRLSPERAEAVRNSMTKFAFWKITPIEGVRLDASGESDGEMHIDAVLMGSYLELTLTGRVDSLSAPKLLRFFERISDENEIKAITVRCANLEYISSAGLRVLLIMQKKCSGGVTLNGINELVREIVEQTGFVDILNVEGASGASDDDY